VFGKYKFYAVIVKVTRFKPLVEYSLVKPGTIPLRTPSYQTPLRVFALLCLAAGVLLLGYTLVLNSGFEPVLAADAVWAGIPVGGLTIDAAMNKVEQAYSAPVELNYRGQTIQVSPETLGFRVNTTAMADLSTRGAQSGAWARLWGKASTGSSADLQASINSDTLWTFLKNEIAARYDFPPQPPEPIPGTTNFSAGLSGWELDVDASANLIAEALVEISNRKVDLVVNEVESAASNIAQLEIFLKQTIANSGFKGIAEVFIEDPNTGELVHFAVFNHQEIAGEIAFSAASTIKIPIMVSVLRRSAEPTPDPVKGLLERMIELSENPPADSVMQNVLGPLDAPLLVTSDMQESLGLRNTFLAGYFYLGASLLSVYDTPANTRTDIDLDPDIYNQTTAVDMGRLLTGIYNCSKGRESILSTAFPGEISQSECQYMLDILAMNEIGVLSEAGVADGTRVSHKHGWTEEADGFLHTVSDVGVAFTPGGDFVFSVYLYDYTQLLFDPADALIAQILQVVYNAYNPQAQEVWLGDPVIFP